MAQAMVARAGILSRLSWVPDRDSSIINPLMFLRSFPWVLTYAIDLFALQEASGKMHCTSLDKMFVAKIKSCHKSGNMLILDIVDARD